MAPHMTLCAMTRSPVAPARRSQSRTAASRATGEAHTCCSMFAWLAWLGCLHHDSARLLAVLCAWFSRLQWAPTSLGPHRKSTNPLSSCLHPTHPGCRAEKSKLLEALEKRDRVGELPACMLLASRQRRTCWSTSHGGPHAMVASTSKLPYAHCTTIVEPQACPCPASTLNTPQPTVAPTHKPSF